MRRVVEVYDHAKPPSGVEALPVEALAAGSRVLAANVRTSYRSKDRIDVVEQPRTSASEVLMGAGIEDDDPPVGVDGLRAVGRHRPTRSESSTGSSANAVLTISTSCADGA